MAMKRPAAAVPSTTVKRPAAALSPMATKQPAVFSTPLQACATCGSGLTQHHVVEAVRYSFGEPERVQHQTMKCVRRRCRCLHGYNFVWVGSSNRRNTVNVGDLAEDTLFINSKVCFDVNF